jgi:excisionase family DNA binding protein
MTNDDTALSIPASGLMPPKIAAQYLGYSVRALEEWRRKGTGPEFLRVRRSIRYRRADVDAWLERQKRSA